MSSLAAPPDTIRYERRSFHPWGEAFHFTSHRGDLNGSFFGWQTFSSFRLSQPEVFTKIRWTGSYEDYETFANNPAPVNTTAWTIAIHTDAGGRPGAALFFEWHEAAEVSRKELGLASYWRGQSHLMHYEFEAVLSSSWRLEAGTVYWISVTSDGDSFKPIFVWVRGAADRNESRWPLDLQLQPSEDSWQVAIEANTNPDTGRIGESRAFALIGHPANDADEDGMDDEWEVANGLISGTDDHAGDLDGDGATNLEEFERGSDPQDPDTDDDGLSDGVESNRGTWVDENDSGTSPLLPDTDRDGLIDSLERPIHTGGEDPAVAASDPNKPDTDLDSYGDAEEHANGFDPVSADSLPAPVVLGIGTAALLGGDLTDPEDDATPDSLTGLNPLIEFPFGPAGGYNLFDNRLGTAADDWCCGQAGSGAAVEVTFEEPVVLTHFTIASGSQSLLYAPRHWAIRGSNDGGQTWANIYSRINWEAPVWTETSQVLEYRAGLQYATPAAYRTIRFLSNGSSRTSGTNFELGELELFGTPHRPRITRFDPMADGTMVVEWDSIPGDRYAVDQSEDLKTWRELADGIESSGKLTRYSTSANPNSRPRQLFFRVRRN